MSKCTEYQQFVIGKFLLFTDDLQESIKLWIRSSQSARSLDKRIKLSSEAGADLFVSLHADSIAEDWATSSIKGATVYTLSDTASDAEAARRAHDAVFLDDVEDFGLAADGGHDVRRCP